jgi:cysteine desulfurase/selenocysteine lyase
VGALDYLNSIGMQDLRDHERALVGRLIEGLRTLPGTRVLGPERPDDRASPVSFVVEGADPLLIAQLLDYEGIAVRAGAMCAYPLSARWNGAVRVSPYCYNTTAEVDRFLDMTDDIIRHRLL